MDDTGTQPQDSPLNGQTSEAGNQETSPKTYTEAELKKSLSDALAKQGREHKKQLEMIANERDSLKTQIQAKEYDIDDVASEREELRKQIDELSKDDPDKFSLVKRDRDLKERERKYKADLRALELEKSSYNTILASDAHNLQHRPPVLSEGLHHAARLIGDSNAEALVRQNPWTIAQGHFA